MGHGVRLAPHAAGLMRLVHRLAAEVLVPVHAAMAHDTPVDRSSAAARAKARGRSARGIRLGPEAEGGGRRASGGGTAAGSDDAARSACPGRARPGADRRGRLGKRRARRAQQQYCRGRADGKTTGHLLLLISGSHSGERLPQGRFRRLQSLRVQAPSEIAEDESVAKAPGEPLFSFTTSWFAQQRGEGWIEELCRIGVRTAVSLWRRLYQTNAGEDGMWNKFRVTAMVASLLAGTAALAYAQSSSTLGTGGSSAGGGSTSTTLGTGGSAARGGSGSGSASTLGTGGSTAGGGSTSTTLGTGGSAAGAGTGSGSASTLGTGGSSAGGGTSSTSLGTGGSAAGTGKSGTNTSSTLGTGGSTAGRERSGSSSTLGSAGSSAGSSTGVRERNQHRFKHGQHMGSTMGNRNAPGLR